MKTLYLKKIIKTYLTLFVSVLLLFVSLKTYAEQPDAFQVIVEPATFDVNQPVDLTIKAVKSDWTVVKDYQWMVMIEFDEVMDDWDYVLPADLYTFTPEDQWVKTWSKWLIIRTKWTYHLKVWDLQDDNIMWEQVLIVGDWGWDWNNLSWTAEIISPMSWETITTQDINVIWKSDVYNTTVQFFLNSEQLEDETKTDINWNFSIYLKWAKKWENKLFVRLVNINWELLAESPEITFNYQPVNVDDQFKWIEISPSKTINAWDKMKFDVKVGDNVNSVELKIWDWWDLVWIFPMDKVDNNHFTKTITIDNDWQHNVSVTLIMQWWERKSYNDIDKITVNSSRTSPMNWSWWWNRQNNNASISNLKVVRDSLVKSQVNVSWDSNWAYNYEVRYWSQKSNLNQSQTTSSNSITIGNLDPNSDYYFQVLALDKDWNIIWQSNIVGTDVAWMHGAWWVCAVGWISVSTLRIWNQFYLSWWVVPWATKYIISRSDDWVNFQKVWETSDTKYPYPFNPNADKKSVFYTVTAVCNDWQQVQIWWAKRVVVWPAENMMLIFAVSLFAYLGYRTLKIR